MSYRDILTMSRNKFLEITYSNRVLFLPIGVHVMLPRTQLIICLFPFITRYTLMMIWFVKLLFLL